MNVTRPPQPQKGYTATTVPANQLGAEELARWKRLCESEEHLATPFLSPAYTQCVAQSRSGVHVCVIRDSFGGMAFLPYQFRTRLHGLMGWAERVSGELSDHFGLIAERGFVIDTDTLLRLSGLSCLYFTHLDEHQRVHGLGGEQPETGLMIQIGDLAAYKEKLYATKRKAITEIDRVQKKLEQRYGPISFDFQTADRHATLERLILQKRSQYARTGAGDPLAERWTRQLLARLADRTDDDCAGVLSTMSAGDTWVSCHFGIRSKTTLHYWFPVYNQELKVYSPGHLLFKYMIEAAHQNGIETIDDGAGDSPAKRIFANSEYVLYRGLWQTSGAGAWVYRAGCAAKWRLSAAQSAMASWPRLRVNH